ncbi:hypothetical protein O1Q96_12180 [Streptomyces sp. Qhu-G9]|uniref:hypothetical protein n=1 Tax=Streptomyces sp. Qhu-G9 TaxID=3452799 RepID=UPI0022ABF393|nr:hypothetical protein [Streptomyces aurantiacus]WAU80451.1 hypothetical protein O1Q96_12180 [Streptomyces aurantiacus]
MTQMLPSAPPPAPPAPVGVSRLRRVLRAVAVVSCVPYVSLKAAWLAGSHLGVPEGSPLLDHRAATAVANGVSVLLDSVVVVLALLLTRPWGLRVPAWLLAVPLWVATGLLAPIMTGYPLQLIVRMFDGGADRAAGTDGEPFLDEWVFGVVYTGFIVQGLALGTLFVLYARDRWGHLWREWPAGHGRGTQRAAAVTAGVLALFPATLHLLWACGATTGLDDGRAEDRTSDFRVLEGMYVVFLAAAVVGAYLLAFRRPDRALSVSVPSVLAWAGSAAVACWGGWLTLASLGGADGIAEQPTTEMRLAYAGQMIVGVLVAGVGASVLAERSKRPA